jgi:hypothetical protein
VPVDPLSEKHPRCEYQSDQADAHQWLHDDQRDLAEGDELEQNPDAIEGNRQQPQRPVQQREQKATARSSRSFGETRLLAPPMVDANDRLEALCSSDDGQRPGREQGRSASLSGKLAHGQPAGVGSSSGGS